MKPVILLSGHYMPTMVYGYPFLGASVNYMDAVSQSGGIPIVVPFTDDLDFFVDMADGLLLTGGDDINPKVYNEKINHDNVEVSDERDEYEIALYRKFVKTGKPIMGICRGLQLLNVLEGGSLYQDIPAEVSKNHAVEDAHPTKLAPDGLLHKLFGAQTIATNSFHHQAVKKLADCYTVMATSEDGIVEGFVHKEKNIFAVQFHPERQYGDNTPEGLEKTKVIIDYFIDLCKK